MVPSNLDTCSSEHRTLIHSPAGLFNIATFASGQRAIDTEISCGEDLQNPQGFTCGSVRAGANPFAHAVDEFPGRPRPGIVICNDGFYSLPTLDEKFDMIMQVPASHDLWHKIDWWRMGASVLLHELAHLDTIAGVKKRQAINDQQFINGTYAYGAHACEEYARTKGRGYAPEFDAATYEWYATGVYYERWCGVPDPA